ncbi:hypothetical protein Asera_19480 [Actinocatenispora sera]|uniref:Gram-positive cocci surface proteins LPxTG domain-containing protein n=1 Tax=Actinocatenispora sera TaxID=390989 RepID=A0A810KX80_9ACTN|nr:hypothetical protein Asera_19480 [Actinocatenispora sera]
MVSARFATPPFGRLSALPTLPTAECTVAVDGKPDWQHHELGGRSYFCGFGPALRAGETTYLTITVKIEKSMVGSDGTLSIMAGNIPDRNSKNDRAAITLTVLSGSAAPSHSASGSVGTGGHGGGDAGGSLPVTGTRLGLYGGAGLLVLLAGVGLVVLGRRRRANI